MPAIHYVLLDIKNSAGTKPYYSSALHPCWGFRDRQLFTEVEYPEAHTNLKQCHAHYVNRDPKLQILRCIYI